MMAAVGAGGIPPFENLALRDKMVTAMRTWFHDGGFTEVETPVRIAAPAPEPHIDCPRAGGAWLRASPELQMKRLVAAGMGRVFQFGPCFRAGECGSRHNPEFTMLEWYRAGASCDDILADTVALVRHAAREATGTTVARYAGLEIDLGAEWRVMTVREAFRKWAGWDPAADFDQDRFDEDMALKIEPALPRDVPFVLSDYPAPAASLARLRPGDPLVAERWELYIGGVEIANAYGELADGAEQRRRFETARAERVKLGEDNYPLDEGFLGDLDRGAFPPCGGIAVGVDRLAMILCGAKSIGEVRAFCQVPGELL